MAELESPAWAAGAPLALCGFTTRSATGPDALACTTQVHGRTVHVVTGPPPPAEGDGLWTTTPGLAVAVRVADCVPILLWDPGVAAVSAVHAGWRGTAQDIAGAAVTRGVSRLGVAPERLHAAIGPCISACCFEVGDEVVSGLRDAGLEEGQFGLRQGPRGRPHVDLRSANRALLLRAGLDDGRIEDVGGCTVCEPERYESYRRDGPRSGRMRGIIALLGALVMMLGCGGGSPSAEALDLAGATEEAREALDRGDADEAEALLRSLLDQHPDDAWLRATLARALHRQGRYREASVQSRLAIGIDPTLWQAAYNLACHYAALGELDDAVSWLQAAIVSGRLRTEDVLADPDLAPLEEDHRFAFYAATGVLSRDEEDAIVLLDQPSVQVGQPATITVVAIALNRPLMAEREAVDVQLGAPLPPGLLVPLGRSEAFSTGTEAGREYRQRTFQFTFSVQRPGLLAVGPFEVRHGDRRRWTDVVLLEVRPDDEAAAPPPLSPAIADPGAFFRAPSADDERLIAAHLARGGVELQVDATSTEPTDLPWTETGGGASRLIRYRGAGVEQLPATVPDREPGAFRSILAQRATEGWSYVLDIKPTP